MASKGVNNMPGTTEFQSQAFWSKISITDKIKDCWEWGGAKTTHGYGNVRINKQYLKAHRVAFMMANGEIPEGYIVCHICDNRSCCNPSHLMLGTTKSNAADMLLKNRQRKRIQASSMSVNGNSKLSIKDVIEIRRSYSAKELNQYQLAEKFNVTQPNIGAILRNETWRHAA